MQDCTFSGYFSVPNGGKVNLSLCVNARKCLNYFSVCNIPGELLSKHNITAAECFFSH